ncbi:hypothetical protein [Cetobacterium ceti]
MTNYELFSREENLDEMLDLMEKLSEKKIEIENIRFAISIIKLIKLENISSIYTMINDILSFIKETNINNIDFLKDEEIIAKFMNINSIKMGLKCFLIKKIKKHKYGCDILILKESLPPPFDKNKICKEILEELIKEEKIEIFLDDFYIIKYPSILNNFHEIIKTSEKYSYIVPILNLIKNGKTFEEIAGMSKFYSKTVYSYINHISNIMSKYITEHKDFIYKEIIFEDIFKNYNIQKIEFIKIFNETSITWTILDLIYSYRKSIDFSNFIYNMDIPDKIKLKINEKRGLLLKIDNIVIDNTRRGILDFFYKNYFKTETKIEKIEELYFKFLKNLGKENDKCLTLRKTSIQQLFLTNKKFVVNRDKEIRYYQKHCHIEGFLKKIDLYKYNNEKIKPIDLFEKNLKLMKEYDLRDEMELYTFLYKNLKDNKYLQVSFVRRNIIFPDKEKVFSKLYKYLNLHELIKEYFKRYQEERIECIIYDQMKRGIPIETIGRNLNIKDIDLFRLKLATRIKKYLIETNIEFEENIYWQIFSKYNISIEEFADLFRESKQANELKEIYNLLVFLNGKEGKIPFENLKNDFLFPGDIRKKVEDLKRKIS